MTSGGGPGDLRGRRSAADRHSVGDVLDHRAVQLPTLPIQRHIKMHIGRSERTSPSADGAASCCRDTCPIRTRPFTAPPNPSAVGTKCCTRLAISPDGRAMRTSMSCKASSRFHASDGAPTTACAVNPNGQIPLDVGRACHRHITHHAQRMHPTTRHRRALARHRPHHHTLAQQPRRMVADPRCGYRTTHHPARRTPPVNHVAIESALTATAIRGDDPSPPPISASASASS